jgi:hypothetical protein
MSPQHSSSAPAEVPRDHEYKRFLYQRIVPHITRLAGDPTGMEAGWETNIGDTKHVNQHIN